MKHLFIPYKLAVIAKEKGFDEPCFMYYDSNDKSLDDFHSNEIIPPFTLEKFSGTGYLPCPLYQQIVDWFREKHKLLIEVNFNGDEIFYFIIRKHEVYGEELHKSYDEDFHGSVDYYRTLNKAIEEAFKLI